MLKVVYYWIYKNHNDYKTDARVHEVLLFSIFNNTTQVQELFKT